MFSRVSEKVNSPRFHMLLLSLLVPCAFVHAQWYDSYEKGREAARRGQWQQAVNHITEALDAEPDSKANKKTYGLQFIDYFPYLYRGIAYYRLGDMVKARGDLEKAKDEGAVDDAQRDKEAPALLAEYLGFLQKPGPQTAQQKPPQNPPQTTPSGASKPDPKFTEGLRLYNQKEYRKALDQLTSVPENSPQHAEALVYIDRARAELKKLETAADQKAKKERIDRAYAAGEEYFRKESLDSAEEQFKNVLALEPAHPGAIDYLNRIKARRQKIAAAAAVPPKENPAAPPHEPVRTGSGSAADAPGPALFREAVALFNAGKIGQAKAKFQSLQTVAPSYPELANYMGLIASVENKVHLGIAAFFEGQYREAIDQLNESSRNGNDNPHVYAFLACSYAAEYLLAGAENRNLKKEAVESFGKVKGIDPRYELDAKLISPGIIALLRGE